jgi:transcriptional regulator with XRE-family HTH domain
MENAEICDFSNFVKKFRKKRDWSQEKLAEKLGVDQGSISNWESGRFPQDFFNSVKYFLENEATVEDVFGIPYKIENVPPADLKFSIDEAAEIVRVGMSKIIGTIGITQSNNILGKGA